MTLNTVRQPDLLHSLFPYGFKASQEEMLQTLSDTSYVLWHAPTGYGKTVVAVVALLRHLLGPQNRLDKIIIFVRMKTQIFRILDECYKISSHYFQNYEEFAGSPPDRQAYPPELLALPLIGKDELCIYPGIRPSKTVDCVSLECELYKAALPQGTAHKELVLSYFLQDLKSTKDIKDFFMVETPNCCPYYVLRSMLLKSHILVTTHTWLLRPELATILHDELNLNSARTAIIIDEVHNFRAHQTG